jgi:DNA repair protein RecN (Recombination protein N)
MLRVLRITNVAVVPALEIEFGEGLNLLTGETGAGKSILVDALGLVLGGRALADVIRTGETHATVEAAVSSPGLIEACEARALPYEVGEDVILRREITAAGKSRATVNGTLVPVAVLRDLAPFVASIQGQHESQGLLDPDAQLRLVDTFASALEIREEVARLFREMRGVEGRLAEIRRDRRELERRREMLDFQVHEIDGAALRAGEDEALRREKTLLVNAGHLADLTTGAYGELYEDEQAILGRLDQVYKKVAEIAAIDTKFQPLAESRDGIRAQLEDLAYALRDCRDEIHASPGRLDEIESRLSLIERLKRKYGATVDEILAFAERCRAERAGLAAPEETEQRLEDERKQLAAAYLLRARELSQQRHRAAEEISRGVRRELTTLAMGKTRFDVRFDPASPAPEDTTGSWSEAGLERLELLLSPNPGEEMRPLARIASGGELSRILLALRTLLDGGERSSRALVFDEVDAGIGGGVAEVVGRKLRGLAARQQVICITHLPQIAAFADHHFRVRKDVRSGRTVTSVDRLDLPGRVEEMARMLGGEAVSGTARDHAREMLRAADVV